jgi:copper chaperone CopZ
VQKALTALPGVANVQTDVENRTAMVKIDPKAFELQKALETLDAGGYGKTALIEVVPAAAAAP